MLLPLLLALAAPADWVPARWPSTDPKSLELLSGTPVNCILVEWRLDQKPTLAALAQSAEQRGIASLAVLKPGADESVARDAMAAHFTGIVLEGDFPARVRDSLAGSKTVAVELTLRSRMDLSGAAPVIGTYQGVWPGIEVLEDGAAKAGPSGSPWINTNSGFLRTARALSRSAIWLGNLPPPGVVTPCERYLQAIGDAAMVGARWILAFDSDFSKRLLAGDGAALKDWKRIAMHLKFYEDHRDWRSFRPAGKLAIIQSVPDGALLSGGILDMISARHTPVRAVPPPKLAPEQLKGASMAVDVDSEALTPEQREVLRGFARSGGTVLTGPPGWKSGAVRPDQIKLDDNELKRLDGMWHEVQNMIGRKNLGARLFNVSSMLSSLVESADGRQVVVQLVNYDNYPVEQVTVHLLGEFQRARLFTPEGVERDLEIYKTEEGSGVDIDRVSAAAAIRLD